RMAARRGKALKLVFAARNRIRAVAAAKVTNRMEPSPNTAPAAIATTDAPPSSVGRTSKATATTVSPTNRMASRTDMAVMVLAAFFDSGGLNAGTPLAMASTPVSATDPPAKALRRRSTPTSSVPNGTLSGAGRRGDDIAAQDPREADRDDAQGEDD